MSKRLHITIARRGDGSGVGPADRWILMAHQGQWGCPILTYRAKPEEPLTPERFIAHCACRSYDAVLDRMRQKAERGIAVWIDGEPIAAEVLLPLLDLYTVPAATPG